MSDPGRPVTDPDRWEAFGQVVYWRERMKHLKGLAATGTLGGPESWQRWLYRGKERAYLRLLKRAGISVQGKHFLDFGCGHGYFVPEVIHALRETHPNRHYLCADLSADCPVLSELGSPDIITAIDVLYHITDDRIVETTLRRLIAS